MSIYLLLLLYLVEWTGGVADTLHTPAAPALADGLRVPIEGGFVNLSKSIDTPSTTRRSSGKISARKGVVFVQDSSPTPHTSSTTTQSSTVKPQSSSVKPQSSSVKPQSSSVKPQSSSVKPQSSSVKPQSSSVMTQSSTLRPQVEAGSAGTRRHKPKFAMTRGEEEEEGRKTGVVPGTATDQDYVVPVALGLVGLPLLLLLLKALYQRGSDFTQRRRYDRMYLIDGMYNAS